MSEQAPDMTLDWGSGWIVDDSRFGYVAVDHEQEAYAVLPSLSQRSIRLEDQRARRETEEAATNLAEQMANRAWAQQRAGRSFRTSSEVFAAYRWPKAEPCGGCGGRDVCACRGETMADRLKAQESVSNRAAMRRRQREREAARTPDQVRIDELQQQVTQLKSRLHALGG